MIGCSWRAAAILAALVAVVVGLTGCSVRTAGAPQGSLTLKATFQDVQGLVVGHSVQMSDVKIGTVTGVDLDPRTYKATVTMSIVDGRRIPRGTRAEIKVTSLLGENYVDLVLPPGGSMARGPFLADGASIADTRVQPSFEQVVGQAGPLLKALAGDDLATIVSTGAAALDGNGRQLNVTVAKSSELIQQFTEQRTQLVTAVDEFARLGRRLAAGDGGSELTRAPAELERTTRMLNDNKGRILKAVERLTYMSRQLNDKVLEGRVLRFRQLLRDLDPVLQQLGDNRERLTKLVNGLVSFADKLPRASYDGQLLLYPILRITWPDGSPVLPTELLAPGGGSAGGSGGSGGSGGGGSGGSGGGQAPPPVSELPKGIRDLLPGLDQLVKGTGR